jgi:hypothetical protein
MLIGGRSAGLGLGFGMRSRELSEVLWDYVLAVDSSNDKTTAGECCVCMTALDPAETLAVLPCQHTYHTECVDSNATPECPVCSRINRKKARKQNKRHKDKKSK